MAIGAVLDSELGEKQAEELVDLGDGGDGRLAPSARDPLLDGDTRRKPLDEIHIGLLELIDELPGIWGHTVEEAALSLGEKDVKGQCRFTAPAQTGNDDHLVPRDIDGDILEVVLAGAAYLNRLGCLNLGHQEGFLQEEGRSSRDDLAEVAPCVGGFGGSDIFGGSGDDEFASSVTSFRTNIDDPVGGLDDVEVVLDHHDAVALLDEALKGFQQDGDVIDVETGGRFVKDEKSSSRFMSSQACSQFEPLGFPAAQDIQRLAELQVVEAYIGKELQRSADGV